MRRKLLKPLLLAAALLIGTSAWADEVIGSTSDAYLANKSTSIEMENGSTLHYQFSQTTAAANNAQGFVLVAKESNSEDLLVALRGDNWENVSWSNNGCINNYNWGNFPTMMNGASVDMLISYRGGVFTMTSSITGSDANTYEYGYTKTISSNPNSIVVYLSEEAAQLTITKSEYTEPTLTDIYYFHQDYENATDYSPWTTPNGILSLSSGNNGKYVTLTQSGSGQRSGKADFDFNDISKLSSYNLSFDWLYSKSSDRANQLVAYTNSFSSSSPGNNNYYEGKSSLINLKEVDEGSNTFNGNFMINNSSTDLVSLSANTWYTFNISVDVASHKVVTTITKREDNSIVLDAHENVLDNDVNMFFKGIWAVVSRNGTSASFDNFKLSGSGVELITTNVSTAAINLAANSADIAVSAESNATTSNFKYYYSTSFFLTDPIEITYNSVNLKTGTYYFYSVNTLTGCKSNTIQYIVEASESVASPTVTVSGSNINITSGTSNAGSNVFSYAVKYATSTNPATEGTALTEGTNTLDQGFYYIYTVSEYGTVSEPTYVEIVSCNKETYDFQSLYNNGNGYNNINNSGAVNGVSIISSITNASNEVGKYINGRFQFNYQNGNGNNWWLRSGYGSNTLFVSAGKSSNFAVKVSANDAVTFYGSNLKFTVNANTYGVSEGDDVVSGKVYFAKEDGYVVINGGAYAQMVKVIVNTDSELINLSATTTASGSNRIVSVNAGTTSDKAALNYYFTTDGTTPTSSSILVKGNEIYITEDCTLKVLAVNSETGNASDILTTDVVCGYTAKVYDFSSAALKNAYGGTTISINSEEESLYKTNNINHYQAYCGTEEAKSAIENFAIGQNGQLAYSNGGLYNNGGGYREFAILNAKKGQKFIFTTSNGSEPAEIVANSNNITRNEEFSNSWVFTAKADGTVGFKSHRYSYINKIEILNPTSVTTTLGANGYTTFASPYPLDLTNLPEGVTAYKAKLVQEDEETIVDFDTMSQTVPAYTGFLLEGPANAEVSIPVVEEGVEVIDNVLCAGAKINEDINGNYAFYGMKKATAAGEAIVFGRFYPTDVTIPADKAYLKVANTEASRLTVSFNGETTGISTVEAVKAEAEGVYNLNGQRVAAPQKGLYIVNGKKVIMK